MEKILLKYNKAAHEKALKTYNSEVDAYNTLIDVVKQNCSKIDIDPESILLIVKYPEMYLFDFVVDSQNLKISGFPMSKEKALGLIDFPKEFKTIIQVAKDVKVKIKALYEGITFDLDPLEISDLVINSEKLSIAQEKLDEISEDYHLYTRNDRQVKAYETVSAIIFNLNELYKLQLMGNDTRDCMDQIFGVKLFDNKLHLDVDAISMLKA